MGTLEGGQPEPQPADSRPDAHPAHATARSAPASRTDITFVMPSGLYPVTMRAAGHAIPPVVLRPCVRRFRCAVAARRSLSALSGASACRTRIGA